MNRLAHTGSNAIDHLLRLSNVEERPLLSGERRVREVLRRCTRPDGERLLGASHEPSEGGLDGVLDLLGHVEVLDSSPKDRARIRDRRRVRRVDLREGTDSLLDRLVVSQAIVRERRHAEPFGNRQSGSSEASQVHAFPPDECGVGRRRIGQESDVRPTRSEVLLVTHLIVRV